MSNYSDKEYEIFSRLFILKEFTSDNIQKLSETKIGIIGIGGIGCPLSQYLISSGVKHLKLVDGDVVEKSNLNRQILFNINDLGKKKAKVAKEKLELINPKSKIDVLDENVSKSNIKFFEDCSIIVDASDNWNTAKLLNKYCIKKSISFVYSSVVGHDLQIILFDNYDKNAHLCLNCIFPNKNEVDLPRCETVGISGISAGIAGLITAQKIINFTLDLSNERNILTISDGKKLTIENIIVKSKHECDLKSI